MNKRLIFVVVACLIACSAALQDPSPPLYNYSYRVAIDATYVVNGTNYRVNGQQFYDPLHQRERVDLSNGRYNAFCGSILPNVTTSCISLSTKGKRYYLFPDKSQCCFCCDSEHGCGYLTPDWLVNGGEYKGTEKIVDTVYDKWFKQGNTYNYLWVSQDANKIPRRLDEGGSHITDYLTHTFRNETFPDSVFALPAYCKEDSVPNCPLQSICGRFRSTPSIENN